MGNSFGVKYYSSQGDWYMRYKGRNILLKVQTMMPDPECVKKIIEMQRCQQKIRELEKKYFGKTVILGYD